MFTIVVSALLHLTFVFVICSNKEISYASMAFYTYMLRSSPAHLLQRPLVLTSIASRSFSVAAPTVWNSLSVNTRSADSFASFKRRLTFELFASSYAI